MSHAPGRSDERCISRGAPSCHDRSDGRDMVSIGRVTHAENKSECQRGKESHRLVERVWRGWRQDNCASSSTPMSRLIAMTRRAVGALIVLTLLPSLALAHLSLRRSDPASGAHFAVAPTRVSLWFTARPELGFSKLRLIGPHGDVALGRILADTGDGMHADIQSVLTPGEYTV